jgi:PleD family two-component response regulator
VQQVRENSETAHIPIIGFADQNNSRLQAQATRSGVTLLALDDALLPQLPHLLEHALHMD